MYGKELVLRSGKTCLGWQAQEREADKEPHNVKTRRTKFLLPYPSQGLALAPPLEDHSREPAGKTEMRAAEPQPSITELAAKG